MKDKLTILWTSGDPVTAKSMVFMYAKNALINDWWKKVEIIVWGSSSKLVWEDRSVRDQLLKLKDQGVKVCFCISCLKELGIDEEIQELGFKAKRVGADLTEIIKEDGKLITI